MHHHLLVSSFKTWEHDEQTTDHWCTYIGKQSFTGGSQVKQAVKRTECVDAHSCKQPACAPQTLERRDRFCQHNCNDARSSCQGQWIGQCKVHFSFKIKSTQSPVRVQGQQRHNLGRNGRVSSIEYQLSVVPSGLNASRKCQRV